MNVIQTSKHSFIAASPVTSVRDFRALGLGFGIGWMQDSWRAWVPGRWSWLHLAHGDGRCVALGLVGGGWKLGEGCVDDVVGVESEYCCVGGFQAFDEVLGGQGTSAGCARFDTSTFVDFVTQGRDFRSRKCGDPADVERSTPMKAEAQRDLVWFQTGVTGNPSDSVPQ